MERNNILHEEPWVDAKTIQKHFGMSKSNFEIWFRRGMPVMRIDKLRRFKISQVEAWLEDYEISAKKSD